MRKVVLDVEDFGKVVDFIKSRQIPIMDSEKAVEVLTILHNAPIMETEFKQKEEK